jgi:hypothetical protein
MVRLQRSRRPAVIVDISRVNIVTAKLKETCEVFVDVPQRIELGGPI